jgi:ABC-2 type transport system permease protein
VTYALQGARAALQDGAGVTELWDSIWVLLVMGAVFVPLGLFVFHLGERYAKKTGKLKRSG